MGLSFFSCRALDRRTTVCCRLWVAGFLFAGPMLTVVTATDGSGSVYPIGAETVLPGLTPAPGASMLANFNVFYMANGVADSQGHNAVPGFHLRFGATAVKFQHNWGVRFLGGELCSFGVLPLEYEHLDGPFGTAEKSGMGNAVLEPAALAFNRGDWHWWYGLDYFAPGWQYSKNAVANIGQHNQALAPAGAFTYLPRSGAEISSKFQYILNGQNNQTLYQSGNEFIWEYDAMQNITRKISVGANGYYYQQTTNDTQNGLIAGDGNRGRDLAAGPELRAHLGRMVLAAKYQKDTLVRNRTMGSGYWIELGVPVGHGHE